MSVDDVIKTLEDRGLILKHKERNGNDTGYQLRFNKGEIVNVFDNGTIAPQGKNQSLIREALGLGAPVGSAPVSEKASAECVRRLRTRHALKNST